MKIKTFTILLILVSLILKSQSICDDAHIINSLPFVDTNVNTAFADADTNGNYCNASGLAGNDTIFTYTPANDETIDIILSNVQIQYNFLVELFIFDDCPDVAGVTCMASATGGTYTINNVNLTAGNTYYIVVTNSNYLGVNSFIFDIEVKAKLQKDLALLYFIQPHSNCSLGTDHEVSLDIKNVGVDTVFGYHLSLKINDVVNINYNYTNDTLIPGQQFTIYNGLDLSFDNEMLMTTRVDFAEDMNSDNDSIMVLFHNLGEVNTFPYYEDFEDTSRWVGEWSKYIDYYPFWSEERTSWQWGEPNANIIDTAASGTKAVVTNLTGNCFQNDKSFLFGPCFDFSSLSIPVIEFDMWKNLDSSASVHLEYTLTDGGIWHRVGSIGTGTNWYNEFLGVNDDTWLGNSVGWVKASHRIPELGGEPHVIFRFVFNNHSSNTVEGFAIDNLRFFEAPNHDIGISEIISPKSSCNLGGDSIKVLIKNYSPDSSHTGFDVKYKVNNGTEIIETVNDTVQANDSLIYTFSTTYDFSNTSEYNIFAQTALINDDDTLNDADSVTIISYNNYSNFPYLNNFETDDGSFFTSGINSSWQWGAPSDSVITSAFSGTKIWATNLNGYHNPTEESYLTSSCFDLSNMKRAYMKFQAMYNLYLFDGITSSYVQVETSLDNGLTWSVFGTSNDSNWYNTGSSWTGSVSDWTQMIHSLSELGVTDNVQFRFKLWAVEARTGFAIDDFEICDAPIAGFNYLASGGEVLFNDTSINGESYEWVFSDGQSSNMQNPTMIFQQDTIDAKLIVTNNCFTDTVMQTIYTVGINDIDISDIKLYPNPVDMHLIIESPKYIIERYEIVDVSGESIIVFNNTSNLNILRINTSHLESGIYFIRLKTKNTTFVKKIVK